MAQVKSARQRIESGEIDAEQAPSVVCSECGRPRSVPPDALEAILAELEQRADSILQALLEKFAVQLDELSKSKSPSRKDKET